MLMEQGGRRVIPGLLPYGASYAGEKCWIDVTAPAAEQFQAKLALFLDAADLAILRIAYQSGF